jgi:hypothetical protein
MLRRLILVPLLVVVAIGCGKKHGDSQSGDSGGEPADPNATYTLKFRPAEKGDKYHVVRARDATAVVKTGNSSQTSKEEFRFEYTETVLDTAPDEPRPTKVTRVYKIARKADLKGEMHDRSYVGKTITIERYLKGYKYSVDGQSLPVQEQLEMNQDFTTGQWRLDQNFPVKPVKVGEEWPVDFAAITAIGGNAQTQYSKEKSKITGKLSKVYKKDGHLWGVIELKIKMVIDTVATNGSPIKGEVDTDATLDIGIDGSARAGNMKMTVNGTIDDRDVIGHERKTTIQGTEERSLTPLK